MLVVDGRLSEGKNRSGILVGGYGSLSPINTTVSRNTVSGIGTAGDPNVDVAHGGGIYARGHVSISLQNSEVSRNTVIKGGGVAIRGGEEGGTLETNDAKIDSSIREIQISDLIYEVLSAQKKVTGS